MSAEIPEASPPPPEPASKTRKGEATRAKILETALDLFRERGYEETTMRGIAEAAGVAVGNAYYYYRSKEHLIQEFYGRMHADHLEASREILASESRFEARLLAVVRAKLEVSAPYHRFAGLLFKSAADPESPLNPFSAESLPVRRQATELMAEVLKGSDLRVSRRLASELPDLLWLYLMGVILFWVHDRSPGAWRSYRLVERTVPIVARLITLARVPFFRPLLRQLLSLLVDLKGDEGPPPPDPR